MTRRPTLRELRRAADRRRGLLAGGLTAAAVATGLSAVAPDAAPVVPVLAAARDLTAGTRLAADDVRVVQLPAAAAPSGVLRPGALVVGRVLGGPVRRGETITDVRLLGRGLAAAAGEVAVPVRVAEPALPLLVEAGDRVDVLAASPTGSTPATTVVAGVAVLAVPPVDADRAEGALLVVAVPPAAAARLATAAVTSRLSVVVRPREAA